MRTMPAEANSAAPFVPINIVGLVVQIAPQHQQTVTASLAGMAGVEVHLAENGQAVVTVDEADSGRNAVDCITDINNLKGVLSTSVAYHHFDQELVTQERSQ